MMTLRHVLLSYLTIMTLASASPLQRQRRMQTSIVDATASFVKSSESDFDHEIRLTESLVFHWNDVSGNSFQGRLVHSAPSSLQAPSWLGFGFYDTFTNSAPVTPETPLMVGSDALIGLVRKKTVEKYSLGGKDLLSIYPMGHQSLVSSSLKVHEADDGTVTTIMSFEKLLQESDLQEVKIRKEGQNVFIWALGAPGETEFMKHSEKGALTLDLNKVAAVSKSSARQQETVDDSNENTSPVVAAQCDSDDDGMDMMVQLTPLISFHWKINPDASPRSISVLLKYEGNAWLGFGVSPDGKMVGSTGIVGLPTSDLVQKYQLAEKEESGVVPLASGQTLQDTSITQEGGTTELRFTKILEEEGEPPINFSGLNTFIFAAGNSNDLGYHEHRGSFRIDLDSCMDYDGSDTWGHMGLFATHGTLAVLAWGIASPFAVTVAWFRTLVPSSWIYIHVFCNVMSFTLTFIAVIIAISAVSMEESASHYSHPHHIVGTFMLVIMTYQVMNGFLRPPVEKKEFNTNPYEQESRWSKFINSPRAKWYMSHRVFGIGMLVMGIYQIVSGLELFADHYEVNSAAPWFWFYVGLFAFFLLALKAWIMLEEYKARRGMENMVGMNSGNMAGSSGQDHQDEHLMPVSFEPGM